MKVAVEGCAHGELEKVYDTMAFLEQKEGIKIDLLICCGDFQSTRNNQDLQCMAVPPKYRDICTFYKYYSGEKEAPVLTIFIGGNHEASNYLSELAYGGWVAPNIFYLGYAGVVKVGGVRIAGLSGIYKGRDYKMGHFEKSPFSQNSMRSVYHIRNLEVFRLKQLSGEVDIALSHDWPRGVYHHGNLRQLLRFKPFFQDDIKSNSLGSEPAEELLHHMKPSYWFSAHLHCKFSALVRHIADEDAQDDAPIKTTKFLALDKCLPKRRFLQVLDIPHQEEKEIALEYDLEWLTVLSLTNHLLSTKQTSTYMPGPGCDGRWKFTPTQEEMDFVMKKFLGNLKVPLNFNPTVPAYDSSGQSGSINTQPTAQLNPQTTAFCDLLGIDDPIALLLKAEGCFPHQGHSSSTNVTVNGLNEVLDSKSDRTDPTDTLAFRPSLKGMKLPSPKMSSSDMPSTQLPSTITGDEKMPEAGNSLDERDDKQNLADSECSADNPILECRIPTPGDVVARSEPSADNPIIESRIPSTPDADASGQGPQAKKFKRRNQAFYTSADDD